MGTVIGNEAVGVSVAVSAYEVYADEAVAVSSPGSDYGCILI
jgi:hypothetical protein